MLARLQVRDKLNLLVVLPLTLAALLLVPWLVSGFGDARTSAATAQTASLARSTSGVIVDLQQARLLAVAYLGARPLQANAFVVQLQHAYDDLSALHGSARAAGRTALVAATDVETPLGELEDAVVAREISPQAAVDRFGGLVDGLIDALALSRQTTVSSAQTWSLGALDALLRSDEASSRSGVELLIASFADGAVSATLQQSAAAANLADSTGAQFLRQADPAAASVFQQATTGPSAALITQARTTLAAGGPAGDTRAAAADSQTRAEVFSAVRSSAVLRQLVEADISQGVAVAADAAARTSRLSAIALGGIGALLLVGVVLLSLAVGRSVSQPLRRLTGAARAVADLAQEELLRVADEDAQVAAAPRLAAIDVRSSDEIGDLADAFNRVQATATLLLERQVVSRRNVATMFASVGRRTSNLVGRQLNLIDVLERAEERPDTLATLYRLDHVSTRLRRSASSLVVLSGGSESSTDGRPLLLADAIRGALGTIEEYQRVTLGPLPEVLLAPMGATDTVLLLAELLENAVLFSPPSTTVEIGALTAPDGWCELTIVDHGMGMPRERLAEENERLKRRERLDLAPTNVLGLFVVGRIARRHGLDVSLRPTADHGITAVVRIPPRLLVPTTGDAPFPLRTEAHRTRTAPPPVTAVAATVDLPAPVQARPGNHERSAGPAPTSGGGTPLQRREPGTTWTPTTWASESSDRPSTPPTTPRHQSRPWTGDDPGRGVPRRGVPRRVPGANLGGWQADPVASPDEPSRPGVIDAEEARRQIETVEEAVRLATSGGSAPGTAPPGHAETVTAARAAVPRRVPGATLDGLERTDPPAPAPTADWRVAVASEADGIRATLDDVDDAVARSRAEAAHDRATLATPPPPASAPPQQAPEPTGASAPTVLLGTGAAPRPARRVPGAALAALENQGTASGVASAPESPQAILDFVRDLESVALPVRQTPEHPPADPAREADQQ